MSIISISDLLKFLPEACAFFFSSCDFAQEWQLGFQDPATPIMEGIVDLHHDIMFFFMYYLYFCLLYFN